MAIQICSCPRSETLTAIPVNECPCALGQIQKLAFQRIKDDDKDFNEFVVSAGSGGTANPITALASWQTFIAATDSTKIVVSPFVLAPEFEPGAARTIGGDNSSLGGIERVIGREATTFSFNLEEQCQETIRAMKQLQCENVGVYLFDEAGNIACIANYSTGTTVASHRPIPIYSLFIGDLGFGGLEDADRNACSLSLYPNWSDNIVIVKPANFNPLYDLN